MQRYASTVYGVIVSLSVRLSQAGTVPKRLNIGSRKQRRMIAQGLLSGFRSKISAKLQQGHPNGGAN